MSLSSLRNLNARMYTESLFVRISVGRRNADWLRGLRIFMQNRRIEDRVKSKGCTGRNRSHSLRNIGLEAFI
ncbi:hypothetical protein Hanom_Chr10g00895281 [Helianthus anomalus]